MSGLEVQRLLHPCTVLVGIDDTDNLTSPGTGWLAQRLLEELALQGLAEALGATRHQLLVDDRVPYTSHNSSACLAVATPAAPDVDAIEACAAAFLRTRSAEGSDPGLAVLAVDAAAEHREALGEFGSRAKTELLDQPTARTLAARHGVRLSGHGGTEDGVIGALAAVGLHLAGSDGFFLWMDGIRQLRPGRCSYAQLRRALPVDDARTADGLRPADDEQVEISPWIRPLLLGGDAVLLLERTAPGTAALDWRVAPRDVVKRY